MFSRARTIADLQRPPRRDAAQVALPNARPLLITLVLCLLVLILPLLLGQRLPLAVSTSNLVMVIGAFALCLLALFPGPGALRLPPRSWLLFLVLVSLWMLLQVWPHPWLARLGPYPELMWQLDDFQPRTWSPDPAATLAAWARLMALFMVVWVVRNLSRRALLVVLACVVASALFQAIYGLAEHVAGSSSVLGVWERNNPGNAHGSFSNRNLYAAYLALCLPAVICLPFLRGLPLLTQLPLPVRVGAAAFASLLLAMAVAGSASRGGFIAFLIAAVSTLMLWWSWPRNQWTPQVRRAVLWLVASMVLLGLLWYGLAPLADRLLHDGYAGRAEVSAAVLREAPAHWWLFGVGVGGFESAFRMIQPPGQQSWYDYLHNDPLQWLLEAGLPAGLLILSLVASALWRAREWSSVKMLAYAGLAGIGFVAFVDFSWHIPATQVVIAIYLGIALRPRHASDHRGGSSARPASRARQRPELVVIDSARERSRDH